MQAIHVSQYWDGLHNRALVCSSTVAQVTISRQPDFAVRHMLELEVLRMT